MMSDVPAFDRPEHKPKVGGEVLWSIRAWVMGMCCKVPVEDRIIDGLDKVAGTHAAQTLLSFMMAVTSGAHRKIGHLHVQHRNQSRRADPSGYTIALPT